MRDLLRLPLVLALICAVAAGTLTWVRDLTGAAIEARAAEALAAALRVALPEASQFNDRSAELPALGDAFRNVHEAYEGVHDGRTVGMVFAVAGPGYGGNVEVLVGIDVSGRIAALKVLSAAGETAGLGTKITEPWFQEQFAGKGEKPLEFGTGPGQLQVITGATISARSVLASANLALQAFKELQER